MQSCLFLLWILTSAQISSTTTATQQQWKKRKHQTVYIHMYAQLFTHANKHINFPFHKNEKYYVRFTINRIQSIYFLCFLVLPHVHFSFVIDRYHSLTVKHIRFVEREQGLNWSLSVVHAPRGVVFHYIHIIISLVYRVSVFFCCFSCCCCCCYSDN